MRFIKCYECNTNVSTNLTTEYCDLCRPHMNEANTNKGETMKKKQQPIERNYGVTSAFGVVTAKAHVYSDFTNEEDDTLTLNGLQVHKGEFMENATKAYRKAVVHANQKAESMLEANGYILGDIDPEVKRLLAEQIVDQREFPNAFLKGAIEPVVHVSVQRQAKAGHWYNLKGSTFTFDLEDLFNVDMNGNPESFKNMTISIGEGSAKTKMTLSAPVALMRKRGFDAFHSYSYFNNETMEWVNEVQEQRIILRSPTFNAGIEIEGERLESTVAPFFKSISEEGEISSKATYFGYDNLIEFAEGLFLMPTDMDESNGYASAKEYDQGIVYGTSDANQALMSDDMAKEAIKQANKEERVLKAQEIKERENWAVRKGFRNLGDKELLNSKLGKLVAEISELTYQAMQNAELQREVNEIISNYKSQARELLKAAAAYKRSNGRALAYPTYKAVLAMAKHNDQVEASKEIAEKVDSEVLELISQINNGDWDVNDLTDEEVIVVRETTLKFWKKSKACRINDAAWSNQLKLKYAEVKGIKVA